MAFEWRKTGKVVDASGTTITYEAEGCNWIIESRKRHIEHANGVGYWDHTTYAIVLPGDPPFLVYECNRLADAKEFVEKSIVKSLSEYKTERRPADA